LRNRLQQEYHTKAFGLFITHFENLLKTTREKLEVAEGNEIYKLQGEARILKLLLKLKENRETKFSKFDGGFG